MALHTSPAYRRKIGASQTSIASRSSMPSSDKSTDQHTPSIFGIMASKRLAKQFVNRFSTRRTGRLPSDRSSSRVGLFPPKEPTYRMEPREKFSPIVVENIMKEVMDHNLGGFQYSYKRCSLMTKILTEEIKERVKKLKYERYKLVCLVTLGENKGQGMRLASRCAWDTSLDNQATYTWQRGQLFCIATVYALYHE